MFLQVGCVCSNAQVREGKIMGVPTEAAILAVSHMVRAREEREREGGSRVINLFLCGDLNWHSFFCS